MRYDKAHIPFSRANTKDLVRWIPGACGNKEKNLFIDTRRKRVDIEQVRSLSPREG